MVPFMDPGVSQFLILSSDCSCLICVGVVDVISDGTGVPGMELGGLEFEFSLEFCSRGLLRAACKGDIL